MDPVDPNIDPILASICNMIGTGMAVDMAAAGKTGIAMNAMYDFWSPARQYQAYHGGARILTESASVETGHADHHYAGRNFQQRARLQSAGAELELFESVDGRAPGACATSSITSRSPGSHCCTRPQCAAWTCCIISTKSISTTWSGRRLTRS
jgi:hypothetical protein